MKSYIATVTLLCLVFISILMFPQDSKDLAIEGMLLWYNNMIPALFPFMILSKMAILLNLSTKIVSVVRPLLYLLFHLSPACDYAICIGFLCGFPMGAATVSDLCENGEITQDEAELLIGFANLIGPIYTCTCILIYIPIRYRWIVLVSFYLCPLLYGMILRYTFYRNKLPFENYQRSMQSDKTDSYNSVTSNQTLISAFESASSGAIQGIAKLGAYMICVNLLRLLPTKLFAFYPESKLYITLLFEINTGMNEAVNRIQGQGFASGIPLLPFFHLGGVSCLMQTICVTKSYKLNTGQYLLHKVLQALLALLFYTIMNRIIQ